MSKTHIAVGIATALTATQPQSAEAFCIAVLGGSIGGVICDLDNQFSHASRDARLGSLLTMGIVAAVLLLDFRLHAGIGRAIFTMRTPRQWAGMAGFAGVCLLCICSAHRSFSHSLLALVLFCGALHLTGSPILFSFACGFLSHILLDVLNRRPVSILFPLSRGVCLDLFYADGVANAVLGALGLLAAIGAALRCFLPLLS